MLYSYGNEINTNASLYSLLVASPIVASFLPYVEIVCMGLYSVLLVMTVLSLTKGYYKYQVRVRVRGRGRGRGRVRVRVRVRVRGSLLAMTVLSLTKGYYNDQVNTSPIPLPLPLLLP